MDPKLSYGAKTLLLNVMNTRRDFLRKSIVTVGGISFLCLSLDMLKPSREAEADNSACCQNYCASYVPGCYNDGCYNNCHSSCCADFW